LDPNVALCLGTYGDPRKVGVAYERGTPVASYAHDVEEVRVFTIHKSFDRGGGQRTWFARAQGTHKDTHRRQGGRRLPGDDRVRGASYPLPGYSPPGGVPA